MVQTGAWGQVAQTHGGGQGGDVGVGVKKGGEQGSARQIPPLRIRSQGGQGSRPAQRGDPPVRDQQGFRPGTGLHGQNTAIGIKGAAHCVTPPSC